MQFVKDSKIRNWTGIINKYTDYYQLMNHWLEMRIAGKTAADYFHEKKWNRIAIYGMADMANRLYEDLAESDICVDYGIDRDVCCTSSRVQTVLTLTDKLPRVDAIVITPFYCYESIEKALKEKTDSNIVSIEEVIWSL